MSTRAVPRVRKVNATTDPRWQATLVQISTPEFSHDDDLPLRISTRQRGLCRRPRVTTIEPIWYRDQLLSVSVPVGFVCDLASIPRWLWWILSPYDIALESIFHDLLYREQPVKRVIADAALLSMLEERGQPWYVRWPVYFAVRIFGGKAWESHARDSADDADDYEDF